ncbi:tetratricopeptide repeat protein [Rhizobium sp.]
MNNNDDTFIREVNEELRSEQLQTAWRRFRPVIIGGAILIVVGVAGVSLFEWWQSRESSASGDRFLTAINNANDKKTDEAMKELEALTKDGFGSYPVLARMRLATVKAEKGDAKGAIADFLAIGKDGAVPTAMRNVAKLRGGWLMVDVASYDEVAAQIEELASPSSAVRHSANEILGLSAYKAGNFAKAREWMQKIVDDKDAPQGAQQRARMILAMITASGKLT